MKEIKKNPKFIKKKFKKNKETSEKIAKREEEEKSIFFHNFSFLFQICFC